MILGLNSTALKRIAAVLKNAEVDEGQLDWRDLQDISNDIAAAVQSQDLRKVMEAIEDMTSLLLSHIQMPEDVDVSQMFPNQAGR